MRADRSGESVSRLLVTRVSEAASALGLSRTKVYELISSGTLPAVRIDGARRIKAADLEAFVRSLGKDAARWLRNVAAEGGKALSTGARATGSGSGCWTWASCRGAAAARPCTARANARCFRSSARSGQPTTTG